MINGKGAKGRGGNMLKDYVVSIYTLSLKVRVQHRAKISLNLLASLREEVSSAIAQSTFISPDS